MTKVLFMLSILLTAIALSAGLAHLFALPNKIGLPAEAYLTVQQIYRGWAMLGMAVVGALAATVALALRVRTQPRVVHLVSTAALCIALSLTVFFLFTWPANQATQNWTALPEDWEALRRQWEYSHAAGALLYFIALAALSLAALGFKGSENLK